jgi:hypothetical protein
MQESVKSDKLNNLLLMYNLIHTVTAPSRITENTKSLLDVMIINKENYINLATWTWVTQITKHNYCAQMLKSQKVD